MDCKKAHGTISNGRPKFQSLFMSVALDSGDVEVLLQPTERFIYVDEECKIWLCDMDDSIICLGFVQISL